MSRALPDTVTFWRNLWPAQIPDREAATPDAGECGEKRELKMALVYLNFVTMQAAVDV